MNINQTIGRNIIIGLGYSGCQIISLFRKQVQRRYPGLDLSIAPSLVISESDIESYAPTLIISPRYDDTVENILHHLGRYEMRYQDEPLEPRLHGQVLLHQYAEEIAAQLRQMQNDMLSYQPSDYKNSNIVNQPPVRLAKDAPLNLFVCMSLADTVMSGLLPDFIALAQYVLKSQTGFSGNRAVHIHPILALPGFANEVSRLASDADGRAQQYDRIHARIKASLDEIDFVTGSRTHYYRKFSPTLSVYNTGNSLGNGFIWLIEPSNEGRRNHLVDIYNMEAMVAKWLYQVIFTPYVELLNPSALVAQPSRKYASFAISSLAIPFNSWLERLVFMLQKQLLERLTHRVEKSVDLVTERQQLGISKEQLEAQLIQGSNYNQMALEVTNKSPVRRPRALLGDLPLQYHKVMSEKVYPFYERVLENMRFLTNSTSKVTAPIIARLEKGVSASIQQNGIPYTFDLIVNLRNVISQELNEIENDFIEIEEKARQAKPITNGRQEYLRQTEVLSSHIFGLPLAIVLTFVGFVVYLLLLNALFDHSTFIWGAIVLGLVSTVLVLSNTVSSSYHASQKLIAVYDSRWQAWKRHSLLSAKIKLYKNILSWLDGLSGGFNERGSLEQLKDYLNRLRFNLERTQQKKRLDDPQILCGLLPDGVSHSPLTPELIQSVEQEIISQDLKSEFADMEQEMDLPHKWLLTGSSQAEIGAKLEQFCHKRLHPLLSQYNLSELSARLPFISPTQSLISRFAERVNDLGGYPYCGYTLDAVQLQRIEVKRLVGVPSLLREQFDAKLLVQAQGNDHVLDSWHDDNEMIIASARYGFLLDEVNIYRQTLKPAYDSTDEKVHTTDDREILPRIYVLFKPIGKQISIRHLTSLALATGVLSWEETEGGFCYELACIAPTAIYCVTTLRSDLPLRNKILAAVEQKYDPVALTNWVMQKRVHMQSEKQAYEQASEDSNCPYWAILAVQEILS